MVIYWYHLDIRVRVHPLGMRRLRIILQAVERLGYTPKKLHYIGRPLESSCRR